MASVYGITAGRAAKRPGPDQIQKAAHWDRTPGSTVDTSAAVAICPLGEETA